MNLCFGTSFRNKAESSNFPQGFGMENLEKNELSQYVKTETVLPSYIKVEETGCLLCRRTKKFYSCRQCHENGHLSFLVQVYSHGEKIFPGVISGLTKSKIQELQISRKNASEDLQRATDASASFRMREKLVSNITQTKKRVEALKRLRQIQNHEMRLLQSEKKHVESSVEQLQRRSQRVQMKQTKIKDYMTTKKNLVKKSATDLATNGKHLEVIRKQQVSDLITHIFPIVGVTQDRMSSSDDDSSDDSSGPQSEINILEEELAEARRLSFVHGRWIYDQGEGPDIVRISIASSKACAPADGDYAACQTWLKTMSSAGVGTAETADSVVASMTEDTEMHRTPGACIYAALCLSTQLMHTMRKLLCIHMPYKHHYRQFNNTNMTVQQFLWNVRRLNGNVLAFCLRYGVEPHLIHPLHTLPNIQNAVQMFLHNPESGTSSILAPDLVASMEEALIDSSDPLPDDDEDRMEELLSEWESSLAEEDWEALMPKESQDPLHPQYTSAAPFQSQAQQDDMGTSQGLVSSAVAWVTKGWWNR